MHLHTPKFGQSISRNDHYVDRATGVDPGFLLGGGAPLRNDVTDRCGKQILKEDTKRKALSRGGGGGVCTPCILPLDPPLSYPYSTICLSRISSDIEIDDVTCGTKRMTTQDILDTSYAVKGLRTRFLVSAVCSIVFSANPV